MRAKAAAVSDFLPNHELLVKQPDVFPFHFFYLRENVSAYENVCVAPVDMDGLRKSDGWAEFDKALGGRLGADVADLCDFTRKAYEQAFRRMTGPGTLKVVGDTGLPKTLVVETAIIAVKPTKAELNVVGTAASFACPAIGIATSLMSTGAITVECRIRDAATGEVVAMYADTENDPTAVIPVASLTWLHSARINIKSIAANTAKVLAAKDYRTIRRDFPIRFAAKIKDASLDD